MSLPQLAGIQVPPATAAWIDKVMFVFLGLFVLWVVLKAIGFFYRRSYNLTPVATAGSKNIRPDFLKVDHAAQKQMLDRGSDFGVPAVPHLERAVSLTSMGMIASGLVTFASAVFLAVGRIEEFDKTWQNLSAKDKFVAIVQSHPVGFAIALAMIVAALFRLTMTLRRAKQ
jgi:hypothetical protein